MSEKSGDWSYCPACGGGVDTGYECGKCGRDWLEYHQTRSAILAQRTKAQQEIARLRGACEQIHYIDQTALLDAINTGDVLRMLEKATALFNQCRDIAQRALAGTKEGG